MLRQLKPSYSFRRWQGPVLKDNHFVGSERHSCELSNDAFDHQVTYEY